MNTSTSNMPKAPKKEAKEKPAPQRFTDWASI